MRQVGRFRIICLVLMLSPAACDDAVGTNYPVSTGPDEAMKASVPPTPAERADALGASLNAEYRCGESGAAAHVTLFGREEMAVLTIDGLIDEPAYLDCAPTRAGPECSNAGLRLLMNTVNGTAELFTGTEEEPLSCTEIQPE